MIDIRKAKNSFKEYVKKYDLADKKIKLKVLHIERTSNIAFKLAKNLHLEQEDIELAQLIGLLHDIGRFEQVKIYNTFIDSKSINHGEYGFKILFEDGLIRNFIEDDKYDKIIKLAILNHNRNKIQEGINEKELLHCKIIRDSDKLDIFEILTFEDKKVAWESEDLSNDYISDEIYRQFMEDKTINYKDIKTNADILVTHFAYVYDFNFGYSLKYLKDSNNLEKLYKRFVFNDNDIQNKYDKIYGRAKKHIESNYINKQ